MQCKFDPKLYVKFFEHNFCIDVHYVDYIIHIESYLSLIQKLKNEPKKYFEMINLGLFQYFLGLEIQHMAENIFLSQPKYALDLLDQFHMSDYNPSPTPFQSEVKLTVDCDTPFVDATLTHSRPDLSFAVSMVSRTPGLCKSLMTIGKQPRNSQMSSRDFTLWCFIFQQGFNFSSLLYRF